jgi:hypothetical protein
MRSLMNWMIAFFMGAFLIFRTVVSLMAARGEEFFVKPLDQNVEVVLLFVALACMIIVFKRLKLGGILYLVAYLGYFGADILNHIQPIIDGEPLAPGIPMQLFCSALGCVLAVIVMIDLLTDHVKRSDDTKTSWFYNNADLDRKHDEREDTHNYKIY